MSSLKTLALSDNQLHGPLPTSLSALTQLSTLALDRNELVGTLPTQWALLSSLTSLTLHECHFFGTLPTNDAWPLLELLSLHTNEFSGVIPTSFTRFFRLRVLDLSRNRISGTVPAQIGSLKELRVLRLEGLMLTGSAPPQLVALNELQELSLTDNAFTGPLPPLSKTMVRLRVNGNKFHGSVPAGQYPELLLMDVSRNNLTGTVPPDLCSCRKLSTLLLNGNALQGSLAECFGSLPALSTLSVADNDLRGSLPASFALSTSIRELRVSGNRWGVSLQEFVAPLVMRALRCSFYSHCCSRLETLEIEHTQLSGTLPSSLFALPCPDISLRGNALLTGSLPQLPHTIWSPFALAQVALPPVSWTRLDLSQCPGFTGALPESWMDLGSLSLLNLSDTGLACGGARLPAWLRTSAGEAVLVKDRRLVCAKFVGTKRSIEVVLDPRYHDYRLCSCLAGYYGRNGLCYKCPEGGDCNDGRPNALPSYWADATAEIAGPELRFHRCPPEYCSRDVTALGEHCVGFRTGTLCGECLQGHSVQLGSAACVPTTECQSASGVLVVVLMCSLAYVVYLYCSASANVPGSSVNELMGYMKILLYFYQVAPLVVGRIGHMSVELGTFLDVLNLRANTAQGSAMDVCAFSTLNTVEKRALSLGIPASLFIWIGIFELAKPVMSRKFAPPPETPDPSPPETGPATHRFFGEKEESEGTGSVMGRSTASWSLVPLPNNLAAHLANAFPSGRGGAAAGASADNAAAAATSASSALRSEARGQSSLSPKSFSSTTGAGVFSRGIRSSGTEADGALQSSTSGPTKAGSVHSDSETNLPTMESHPNFENAFELSMRPLVSLRRLADPTDQRHHCSLALLAVSAVSYMVVVRTVFELLMCVEVDGSMVLYLHGNTQCYAPFQVALIVFSIILSVYPLALGGAVLKLSQKTYGTRDVAVLWAVARHYRPHFPWWDAVLLYRRLFLALAYVFTSVDPDTRGWLVSLLSVLALVTTVYCRPWRSRLLQMIDSVFLFLLCVLAVRDDTVHPGRASNSHHAVSLTLLSVPLVVLVLMVLYTMRQARLNFRAAPLSPHTPLSPASELVERSDHSFSFPSTPLRSLRSHPATPLSRPSSFSPTPLSRPSSYSHAGRSPGGPKSLHTLQGAAAATANGNGGRMLSSARGQSQSQSESVSDSVGVPMADLPAPDIVVTPLTLLPPLGHAAARKRRSSTSVLGGGAPESPHRPPPLRVGFPTESAASAHHDHAHSCSSGDQCPYPDVVNANGKGGSTSPYTVRFAAPAMWGRDVDRPAVTSGEPAPASNSCPYPVEPQGRLSRSMSLPPDFLDAATRHSLSTILSVASCGDSDDDDNDGPAAHSSPITSLAGVSERHSPAPDVASPPPQRTLAQFPRSHSAPQISFLPYPIMELPPPVLGNGPDTDMYPPSEPPPARVSSPGFHLPRQDPQSPQQQQQSSAPYPVPPPQPHHHHHQQLMQPPQAAPVAPLYEAAPHRQAQHEHHPASPAQVPESHFPQQQQHHHHHHHQHASASPDHSPRPHPHQRPPTGLAPPYPGPPQHLQAPTTPRQHMESAGAPRPVPPQLTVQHGPQPPGPGSPPQCSPSPSAHLNRGDPTKRAKKRRPSLTLPSRSPSVSPKGPQTAIPMDAEEDAGWPLPMVMPAGTLLTCGAGVPLNVRLRLADP